MDDLFNDVQSLLEKLNTLDPKDQAYSREVNFALEQYNNLALELGLYIVSEKQTLDEQVTKMKERLEQYVCNRRERNKKIKAKKITSLLKSFGNFLKKNIWAPIVALVFLVSAIIGAVSDSFTICDKIENLFFCKYIQSDSSDVVKEKKGTTTNDSIVNSVVDTVVNPKVVSYNTEKIKQVEKIPVAQQDTVEKQNGVKLNKKAQMLLKEVKTIKLDEDNMVGFLSSLIVGYNEFAVEVGLNKVEPYDKYNDRDVAGRVGESGVAKLTTIRRNLELYLKDAVVR